MIKIKIDEIGSIKTVGSEIQRVEHQENMVWGELPKIDIMFVFEGDIPRSISHSGLQIGIRGNGKEAMDFMPIKTDKRIFILRNLNRDNVVHLFIQGRTNVQFAEYKIKVVLETIEQMAFGQFIAEANSNYYNLMGKFEEIILSKLFFPDKFVIRFRFVKEIIGQQG